MQIQFGTVRYVFQVIDQNERAAEDPAGRVSQRNDRLRVSDQPGKREKVDLSENDEGREHDQHRRAGITGTAQRSRKDVMDAAADSEGGNGVQEKAP